MALSFAKDIRPLFRDTPDVDTMKDFGLDLSSFADVKAQAEEIYARVLDGTMPCDEPWPKDQVALFKSGWKKAWRRSGGRPSTDFSYPLSNACFFSNSSRAACMSTSNFAACSINKGVGVARSSSSLISPCISNFLARFRRCSAEVST